MVSNFPNGNKIAGHLAIERCWEGGTYFTDLLQDEIQAGIFGLGGSPVAWPPPGVTDLTTITLYDAVTGGGLSSTNKTQALEDEVAIKVSTHCGATEAAGFWFQGGN